MQSDQGVLEALKRNWLIQTRLQFEEEKRGSGVTVKGGI